MQINFKVLTFAFFTLVAAACGSTNQSKEDSRPTTTKGAAISNNTTDFDKAKETPTPAPPRPATDLSGLSSEKGVLDKNGKKVRAVPSSNTGTREDLMKKRLAEQNGQTAPKVTVKAPSAEDVKNSKLLNTKSTETVTTPDVKVPTPPSTPEVPAIQAAPSHDNWNKLLSKYVSDTGKVNYKGFKLAQGQLEVYLKELQMNTPQSSWSRSETKAYWLNAYNAFTIKKIVDNYPLKSITDLANGKVWDEKWIKLGDKTYSLNNIENDIIRPKYDDGRIHFAVNCAAISCPPLYNRAFTASGLDATLTQLTKKFVNNSAYNSIAGNSVTVSKIFDWYADDFGDLIEFLNKYATGEISEEATIQYKEYDWGLNE